MKIFEDLGRVALGSRLRFMSETITADAAQIYRQYGIEMNPKWFPVFFVLSKESEKTITSIADDIGHSHVSVSKIVREMIKAGLVAESASKEDRRRTLVSLSKRGQKIAVQIEDQYKDVQSAVEELSAQASHDLWKALEEWEYLLSNKSLFQRVMEKRKERESSQVKIVPYETKYREDFRKLNLEWIQAYFKVEKADRLALDDPEGYILKNGGHIFVALVNDQVLGVCALLKRKDTKYPYELAKMAVSPAAQGKGVGYLLGQAVIKKAKQLKSKNLYLESNTILKPAIRLYEKLGFQKVVGLPTPYERANIQMELKF